jgi:hypothetical protein
MDPKQVILEAIRAADEKDWDTCRYAMDAYAMWRQNKGFAPVIGTGWTADVAYTRIVDQLRSYGELRFVKGLQFV